MKNFEIFLKERPVSALKSAPAVVVLLYMDPITSEPNNSGEQHLISVVEFTIKQCLLFYTTLYTTPVP